MKLFHVVFNCDYTQHMRFIEAEDTGEVKLIVYEMYPNTTSFTKIEEVMDAD